MSAGRSVDLLEGSLDDVALERVLERLGADHATGILTVQSHEDIVAISFDAGRIVGADALNETLEDGLGGALVTEGLVTAEQFEAVLARVRSERVRLSDALVDEGLLSRADYVAAMRRYTLTLVARSASWRRGDFKFYAGDDVAYEEGLEPIGVAEVAALPVGAGGLDRPAAAPAAEVGPGAAIGPDEELGPVAAPEFDPAAVVDLHPVTLAAEEPPDGALLDSLRRRLPLRLAEPSDWAHWVGPTLAALLLLAVVLFQPNSLFYPFFWSEPERLEFEKQRRSSVYLKIDRAAKTFFLLEGRFPDDLTTLEARGLLARHDIVGSKGRILGYRPDDRGYVIRSAVDDGTDAGVSKPEAIAGNFFLDPEFVERLPEPRAVPLVLLD